jgi:hypothetical protein
MQMDSTRWRVTILAGVSLTLAACSSSVPPAARLTPGVGASTTVPGAANPPGGPATTVAPGPPSSASVVNGRFVEPVVLDGGAMRVDPPRPGQHAILDEVDAATEIWASASFTGYHAVVLGFGVVTIAVPGGDAPAVRALPAWVGFASGNATACPAQIGPSTSAALPPDNGDAAVVLGASDGTPAVAYKARTSICGQAPIGPTVTGVDEVVSVPWTSGGPLQDGTLTVLAQIPRCGASQGIATEGTSAALTVSAYALVNDQPDNQCPPGRVVTEHVPLAPGGPGAPPPVVSSQTVVLHGPLGPSRQAS